MKKLLATLLVAIAATALVGCVTTKFADTFLGVISETNNINPHSQTLQDVTTLAGLVTGGLYDGDIDWEASGKTKGDFTNSSELKYNYLPVLASGDPIPYDKDGNVVPTNPENADETYAKTWEIPVKEGLVFENGDPITAETFVQSWKLLLDPLLINARATSLTDSTYLPIIGAYEYYAQGKPHLDVNNNPTYTLDGEPDVYAKYYIEVVGDPVADPIVVAAPAGWYKTTVVAGKEVKGALVPFDEAAPKIQLSEPNEKVYPPKGGTPRIHKVTAWEDVQLKSVGNKIVFAMKSEKSIKDVKAYSGSSILAPVHVEKYIAGLTADKTSTTYGTRDNKLISSGPYKILSWQNGVEFNFVINPNFEFHEEYNIKKVTLKMSNDQDNNVKEFRESRLDVVGVGGTYWNEFSSHPNVKKTPSSSTFRFATNAARGTSTSIKDFREALYFAIDRKGLVEGPASPGIPTQTLLNDNYFPTFDAMLAAESFRGSEAGKALVADRSPATNGYNAPKALELFNKAYATALEKGIVAKNGDPMKVEYVYMDASANKTVAAFVKQSLVNAFQAQPGGVNAGKFEFLETRLSSDALTVAIKAGNFDITFGAWGSMDYMPAQLLGLAFDETQGYMDEKGFTTSKMPLTIPLSDAGIQKISEVLAEPDNADLAELITVTGNDVGVTYGNATLLITNILYKWYAEKDADYNAITAAMEGLLLDEIVSIPLFGRTAATVYSSKIIFMFDEYNVMFGWGTTSYKYISLKQAK